jgi:hypothetical protein
MSLARKEFPMGKSKKNAPNSNSAQGTSAVQVSRPTMNRKAFIVIIIQDTSTTIVLCILLVRVGRASGSPFPAGLLRLLRQDQRRAPLEQCTHTSVLSGMRPKSY